MKFAVAADLKAKIKESESRHKYWDLTREQRKLWNMSVTVIQIVIGALGTVPEGLERGLEKLEIGRAENFQTTALLISARILRRVLET